MSTRPERLALYGGAEMFILGAAAILVGLLVGHILSI